MEQIEGVVEDVVYRNPENGWSVLTVKSGRERITCVGALPEIASGERMKLTGEWTQHRDYGQQLKIASYEHVKPTTVSGIERYLGSGVVRGVGPATAKLIVHAFGKRALEILDDAPERLTEIPGIGPKRAQMIAESYQSQREARAAMVFLQTYGIGPALAGKVIRAFGSETQNVVRKNPYILAEKVEGIGFRIADGIGTALGIEPESEGRLRAGVVYAIDEAVASSGHAYLPRAVLIARAAALLGVAEGLIERTVDHLVLLNELIAREVNDPSDGAIVAIYLRRLYEAEGEVAARLTALTRASKAPIKDAEAKVRAFEKEQGVTLCDEQREAVLSAAEHGVSILTGGPGTGKTTCLHCMLSLLRELGPTLLCAPTGRAAKRMSEAADDKAQTIHRLLEYNGESDSFGRNEDNPLEANALIVDETSMVDIFLMRSLLRALAPGCRLVLVGDADQLPSVGAGNVLGDMIASEVIPVVRLRKIFRQAGESTIVKNAHRINRGEMPIWNKRGGDFFFERAATGEDAARITCALISERLPKYLGVDWTNAIQVMSPMKKGEAGVWALNRTLQAALNPPDARKREMIVGQNLLREGDKVMQVRNNYDLEWSREGEEGVGAFNGDLGLITAIDPEERTVTVTFDDDRVATYGEDALDDLDMAYAMSVHKSQGSEFEAIVLLLVSGPPMLFTRNLLYTAVTRARRLVVLVGREETARRMTENNYVSKRYTALAERLREMP